MTRDPELAWRPEDYDGFRGVRLRPALDLLARVPIIPDGNVIDLGCGSGAIAPALRKRFPRAHLIGVDQSGEMLTTARATGLYDEIQKDDAETWQPTKAPALIFSNALLHWLPDHRSLFPRLAGFLKPGGYLAIQMPRQFLAPSHVLLRETAARMFPDRFDVKAPPPAVEAPEFYAELLSGIAPCDVWECNYIQRLEANSGGHPVREFTATTAMRPFAAEMSDDELAKFLTAYDIALSNVYPLRKDGSVWFPFRRVFIVLGPVS